MEKFDPIDIEFLLNNEDVKNSSKKIKDDLNSIGQTAEETAEKVQISLEDLWKSQSSRYYRNPIKKQLEEDGKAIEDSLKEQANQLEQNTDITNKYSNSLANIVKGFRTSSTFGLTALQNNIPQIAGYIEDLKKKNDELNASGKKGAPIFEQLVKGMFSWTSVVSIATTVLLVFGKQIFQWISALYQGKEALDAVKMSQEALNDAFDSNTFKAAIQNVLEMEAAFKSANEGVFDKTKVLKQYNDTLGDVMGATDDYATAEANLNSKAPAYVEAMLYRAAATAAASEAAKQLVEDQKEINKLETEKETVQAKPKSNYRPYNPYAPGGSFSDSELIKAETNTIDKALEERQKKVKERKDATTKLIAGFNELFQKAVEEGGLNFDAEEKKVNAAVSQYQSLLDKLAELDKEYARKNFTKDEEELQALRDKFDKIRTLVQRFNADPKNKAQIIDLKNLDELEKSAIGSLTYRQTTDKLKDELDAQKKLFADFESYKATFGQAAAEKEFEGKIDTATNYYDFLKTKQKENAAAFEKVAENTATGPETERVSLLNKAIQKETDEQKRLFDKQLAQLLDYQKKRNLLIEQYQTARTKLVSEGENDAVAELDRQHQEELDQLDDNNLKKLASYKQLFDGIVGLTYKEAQIVIDNAKQMVKTLEMSGEAKAKILKQIAEVDALLKSNKRDDVAKYAIAIGQLGDALNSLGTALGSSALASGGALLSGLSSGVGNFLDLLDDIDNKNKAGIIAAGITGVVNIIGNIATAAQKRREAEEQYYLSMIGFQHQYNLSLKEQIRLKSILDENIFVKDYQGRITDALASIKVSNDEYQEAMKKLAEMGRVKIGQRDTLDWKSVGSGVGSGALTGAAIGSIVPVVGTAIGAVAGAIVGGIASLFGGKKKKDKFGNILQEYPELIQKTAEGVDELNIALAESLVANNLVNEETKAILENIIDWQTAIEEARNQIREVIEELSGGLGNDIKNSLVDAFQSGEDAAIKMGESVEKVLENVLSSFIFSAIFDEVFTELEKQMAESMDVGGDGTWVDDFTIFFTNASKLTDDFNEALALAQKEAADMGFDIFKPENDLAEKKQGLSGAIRRELTEATGSELAGLFRGQFDITKRLLEGSEAHFEIERSHYTAMLDLVAINTKIETNTKNTVDELQRAYDQLEAIADNTRASYLSALNS